VAIFLAMLGILARIEADGPSEQITATNSQGEIIVIQGATGRIKASIIVSSAMSGRMFASW
jgi:hypothetical protein